MDTQRPAATVIVPAYRADATLDECLAALLDQRFAGPYEVILVASADRESDLPRTAQHDRLRTVLHVPRLTAAAARNRGAALARGHSLAFCDADAVADPDWLATLVAATAERCAAGAVVNGTPESAVGTADYLLEFLDVSPARRPDQAWHGVFCNLALPAELWAEFGPLPEDEGGAEDTSLTLALGARGQFVFCPSARVTHRNRVTRSAFLHHQYKLGRYAARCARRSPTFPGRVLLNSPALAPVAGLARALSLVHKLATWARADLVRSAWLAPLIAAGLFAWSWGALIEGHRLGRGDA